MERRKEQECQRNFPSFKIRQIAEKTRDKMKKRREIIAGKRERNEEKLSA